MARNDDEARFSVVRSESGVVAANFSSQERDRLRATRRSYKLTKNEYRAKSLAVDLISATVSSFFVAIPVATIDRAVVQNVAGVMPLRQGLTEGCKQMVFNPVKAVTRKSFLMVSGVYAATYVVANSFDSAAQMGDDFDDASGEYREAFSVEDGLNADDVNKANALQAAKFLGVTAANMSTAVGKDRAFARMYGTISPSKLPMASWGLWLARDLLTIGAAFSLPKPLAEYLSDADDPILSERSAAIVSQLVPVMAVQLLSTPLHLLANDVYNYKKGEPRVVDPVTGKLKSGAKTTAERMSLLKTESPKTFVARLFRIAPAFGIGGLGNAYIRDSLRTDLHLA